MKSNLLKSIFISLILVMGVGSVNAETIMRVYCKNTQSWWKADGAAVGAYYWGTGGNANSWPGTRMTKVSGQTDLWYIDVDIDKYQNIIFTRVNGSGSVSDWGAKTNDLTIANTKNQYTITQSSGAWNGATSAGSWGTYKPTSTVSLTASPASVYVDEDVTLTPSLSSNTDANTYSSTSYSVSPATASVNGDTFTATAAGTYTVTATITYYAKGCPSLTSTATATATTITVKQPTHTVTFGVHSSGNGTLTAKAGSTSISSGASVDEGTKVVFTATPSTGYQVEGWYSNSGCTSKITAAGTSTTYDAGTLTADKTVYVKFEAIPANSHNITYTAQGTGWTYGNSNPTTAEEGATVTFVVNPTAGYRVDVSSDGPALTGPNANNQYTFAMPTKDVKITVEAKPEQYTVTLNKQSGEGGTSSVTATYLAAMPSITAPTRTGYTFNGYFDADSGGTKYYNTDGSSAKNWDKTAATILYAKWTANTYSITYKDQNNAAFSGTHASGYPTTHTYGTATTLKTASKTGYTFDGWFTSSNCSGTAVNSLGATTYTSDITLYAKWTEIPPTTVYFKPINDWKGDNTRFAVYYWEGNTNGWIDMIEDGCTGEFYKADIPAGFTNIKFVSFPTDKENNWNYDINRTEDLKVPNDGKVLYDMASTNITTLYLNPGVWNVDGAWFPAYFFSDGEAWKKMTDENRDNIYACEIPENKKKVIFVRKNPSNQDLNFNDKWAQTGDLTIPTDGKNMFSISDWDNNGSWDKVWDNSCWTTYEPSNTYTISFDRQGATTGTESVEATVGDAAPDVEIERTGYTFGGYYTEANGEGTQIIDAEGKWINGTNYVDADGNWSSTDCNITFYAQWTEKLSTITIIVSEGGSVKVDGEDFVSGNTVQVGVATFKTITLHPNAGYGIAAFGVDGDAWIAGNGTYTLTAKGSGSTGTLYANFVALENTITWNPNGGKVDPTTSSYTYNGTTVELPTPTRDGFTFVGWFTEQSGGTQITEIGTTNKPTSDVTYYAHWQGAPYTVTLDQTGAASTGTEEVIAHYEADMPTADVTMPTAQNGYAFMGYWDEKEGKGTQYYDANGASAHTWDKTEDATLYAYFKKAEITTINLDKNTFEPVEAGSTGFVTATPIIEPTPTGNTIICWRLLYSNGSEVEGRTATQVEGNTVKFSIAGLASGNYKIEAVLRTGNNCGSGTELSTKIVNFTIASTYTITVKYTCDGKEIMAATKTPAHVTEETEITAPDIPGYTFSKWVAGDGVTITDAQNGENTNETIKFTAIYDGYLTAQYTTKPMVYFKNTLGWEKVYVYTFSNNAWWNNGTGVHPNANKLEQGEMKLVEGTDDIYYFELTNTDGDYTQENNANNNYIAFSSVNYIDDNDYFKEGQAVYRGDHKNNLTLFIPQADQEPEKPTNTQTQYYNKGIWMKYNSTESGYQIPSNLPGGDWNTYTDNFTTTNPGGYTFSITKNLAANTEYEFKIRNYVWIHNDWEDNGNGKDNNQWFGNNGNITESVSNWHFHDQNAEKKGYDNTTIKTTAAGEYIFTIDLSQGKVLLSVEYPIAVGDYRVIYKDNATWSQGTAHDANWYHPSRIIKENKTNETTKDIISFFISHGNNPTMKFQKVTSITNGNVTWEDAGAAKIPDNITKPGVYNFVIIQESNGTSISMEEQAEPYTGNYYIRVDALAGKWDNYKTHSENRMTYSAFSESEANSFGEKFSHYATKYCTNGTNIKFTIANDYSPCISDTLAQDITNPLDNLDSEGTLLNNDIYSANVRFMWHHKTNKISRAYVGPAADKQSQFLMLRTKDEIQGAEGELDPDEGDIVDAEKEVYAARFADTQNWIYERTIKVKPGTRVKLYASYPNGYHIYIENNTGWKDVALYAFKEGEGESLGTWPGIQPTRTVEIEGKTYYDFPVNKYVFGSNLIFNNNGGGEQKDNYQIPTIGDYYLTASSSNSQLSRVKFVSTTVEAKAQYFRGAYDNNNETWDDNNSIVILGGSGTDWNTIRVIYDFKTNRLMAALVPDQEVSEEKIIAADVMIIRKHQENATCITLTNDNSKLTEVKTVYGSLQFNRWVLNNRDSEKSGIEYCTKKINNQDTYDEEVTNDHHPILSTQDQKTIYERALYFISFPFDVHLSDVFGFGTYGTHWVISTYNGQRRAQNGYFVDNCMNEDCTNWDYIWDPSDFTMKANQGYLLSLDLDLMKYNNTDFWLHNIDQVELFFPSTADLKTIEKTNYQMPALTEDYECTINFNKVGPEDPTYNPVNDHRVRDSYWRCIGVPSFANYDGSLYKTEQDAENEENPINWKTNYTWQADNAAFPFLYEWNVTDNSLQVQNTSNFNFKATFAYLVQNGNSIYWSAVNAKPSNIVARSQEAKRNYDWKITIARNGEVEDQTFVRLTDHEKVTTEFDFNQDLSKEFNYGRSDIYTLIGYEKAAANSLPLSEQTTLIPLGLSIENNGDYTIAMPDGTANIGVTLIDTESNTRTNLSAGMEYTLTLKKGDYNNRFFIEISPIQQTPTDIEYVENSHDDQARKVLIDNILYIVRDGQMFDARGARVK